MNRNYEVFPLHCGHLLMVAPTFFDIEYAINPYMTDEAGKLKVVDKSNAQRQWQNLKATFEAVGLTVDVIEGQLGFPDMVFCANQSFPFVHPDTKRPSVVMSRMRAVERQGEVAFFRKWFEGNHYDVYELEERNFCFESNGDLIPHPGRNIFWGGYGARTDKTIYEELGKRFNLEINVLELCDPYFYHLDTCFSVLDQNTVAFVREALSAKSVDLIRRYFSRIIEINRNEALTLFAGNCFCPDGKNIVIEKGAIQFGHDASALGFKIHEVETSEFMKAGGSVFCMKLGLVR